MSTLRQLHEWLAWFMVLSNAAVGVWALVAYWQPRLRVGALWWATGVAQVSAFAIAIVGTLMVTEEGVELDEFHALYGFAAILAVGILYSYRTSPFMKGKEHLLYGCGSLFIMGLGIRNFFLG